jgi:hypothetical protein
VVLRFYVVDFKQHARALWSDVNRNNSKRQKWNLSGFQSGEKTNPQGVGLIHEVRWRIATF